MGLFKSFSVYPITPNLYFFFGDHATGKSLFAKKVADVKYFDIGFIDKIKDIELDKEKINILIFNDKDLLDEALPILLKKYGNCIIDRMFTLRRWKK